MFFSLCFVMLICYKHVCMFYAINKFNWIELNLAKINLKVVRVCEFYLVYGSGDGGENCKVWVW